MPKHTPQEKERTTSHGSHLTRGGGTTARQAGQIRAPANSPAMSSLTKLGGISGRK